MGEVQEGFLLAAAVAWLPLACIRRIPLLHCISESRALPPQMRLKNVKHDSQPSAENVPIIQKTLSEEQLSPFPKPPSADNPPI
jgi:hypothetical protein